MSLTVGEVAPHFALPDERGQTLELPATGQPTVLVFYRGDW